MAKRLSTRSMQQAQLRFGLKPEMTQPFAFLYWATSALFFAGVRACRPN